MGQTKTYTVTVRSKQNFLVTLTAEFHFYKSYYGDDECEVTDIISMIPSVSEKEIDSLLDAASVGALELKKDDDILDEIPPANCPLCGREGDKRGWLGNRAQYRCSTCKRLFVVDYSNAEELN
jgi:hypothetical protein